MPTIQKVRRAVKLFNRKCVITFEIGTLWQANLGANSLTEVLFPNPNGCGEQCSCHHIPNRTLWNRQSPSRVAAFQNALRALPLRRINDMKIGLPVFAVIMCIAIDLVGMHAEAARQVDGVYCVDNRNGTRIFAVKSKKNGDVLFGLSIWFPNGQNTGAFGTAIRQGSHWEYTKKDVTRAKSADQCKIDIVLRSNGLVEVNAPNAAACRDLGGYGTEIGHLQFPPNAYEGAVANELNDPETFFGTAGKCWKSK